MTQNIIRKQAATRPLGCVPAFLYPEKLTKEERNNFLIRAVKHGVRRIQLLRTPVGETDTQKSEKTFLGEAKNEVIVISANLWHDWPRHRRLPDRLEAFAGLVEQEGAQVVLLQEVMRTTEFRSDVWLANRLGMTSVYARANGHTEAIGFEEGSAVLSTLPLRDVRQATLGSSASRLVNRIALGAQFQIECCNLWAFSTHLSLFQNQNGTQLSALQDWIEKLVDADPALIGGDFNAHEDSQQIRQIQQDWIDTFRRIHPGGQAVTHSIDWPWGGTIRSRRLDYIFLNRTDPRWQVAEARHLRVEGHPHSDHAAVLTRLRYLPSLN